MLLAATLSVTPLDLLNNAVEYFHTVDSYRVTIHSTHAEGDEHLRYYYRKPGFVRMEFIHPHAGAVLVYNPASKRVRLWPFGEGHFPELNLAPDNPLLRSSRDQQIDRSDVGALLENVSILCAEGHSEILGEESEDGHTLVHLVVTGSSNFALANLHSYELWLDSVNQFPVKVISRDRQNAIIETVIMQALEINLMLQDALFNP